MRTSTAIGLRFFNFDLEYLKRLQSWSCFIQKCLQAPASLAHGLYRILSSYWLAHFYFMKNPPKCCTILPCGMFVWTSSELWRLILKTWKPVAVDVLFKAYQMVSLSCRSNLAGRYFLLDLIFGDFLNGICDRFSSALIVFECIFIFLLITVHPLILVALVFCWLTKFGTSACVGNIS